MNARDVIYPSLFGDALALGYHWIYDGDRITGLSHGAQEHFLAPHSKYHPDKQAGDFTHYGDQTLVLLESLAARNASGWTSRQWREDWLAFWQGNPASYRDGATRLTLEHAAQGIEAPSDSHELGGAARIAPIVAMAASEPQKSLEWAVQAAREATAITHGAEQVIDTAEWLTRMALRVVAGEDFATAIERTQQACDKLPAAWLEAALSATSPTGFGLGCDIAQALPLALGLALMFEQHPVDALETNALLGGDSAARGLVMGLLLGCRHGLAAFPEWWLQSLNARARVERALQRLAQ